MTTRSAAERALGAIHVNGLDERVGPAMLANLERHPEYRAALLAVLLDVDKLAAAVCNWRHPGAWPLCYHEIDDRNVAMLLLARLTDQGGADPSDAFLESQAAEMIDDAAPDLTDQGGVS